MPNEPLTDYLAALASGRATPGGGSVAALNGALGAALICMVCNLSLRQNLPTDIEYLIKTALAEAETLQTRLTSLSSEDSRTFQDVVNAHRLSKQTEAEKLARKQALEDAYKQATRIPLQTAQACVRTIILAEAMVKHGQATAAGDAGAAALSALAGLKTARLNIAINLKFISDEAFLKTIRAELEMIAPNQDGLVEKIYELAQGR